MDAGKTGAYLAALRKARGMTQQEAADQLGVSNNCLLYTSDAADD